MNHNVKSQKQKLTKMFTNFLELFTFNFFTKDPNIFWNPSMCFIYEKWEYYSFLKPEYLVPSL